MNLSTQVLWELLPDQPLPLLEQIAALMRRSYAPFLPEERAFRVNACVVEQHLRDEFDHWYDWLPETPINVLAGQCALALLDTVEWETLARLLHDHPSAPFPREGREQDRRNHVDLLHVRLKEVERRLNDLEASAKSDKAAIQDLSFLHFPGAKHHPPVRQEEDIERGDAEPKSV